MDHLRGRAGPCEHSAWAPVRAGGVRFQFSARLSPWPRASQAQLQGLVPKLREFCAGTWVLEWDVQHKGGRCPSHTPYNTSTTSVLKKIPTRTSLSTPATSGCRTQSSTPQTPQIGYLFLYNRGHEIQVSSLRPPYCATRCWKAWARRTGPHRATNCLRLGDWNTQHRELFMRARVQIALVGGMSCNMTSHNTRPER